MIAKKVGNFGIILTRRYLLYIAMVIAALLSIYTFVLVDAKTHAHRKLIVLKDSDFYTTYRSHIGDYMADVPWGLWLRGVHGESSQSFQGL